MPRNYTAVFENVTVSAAQDLFQIIGAAGKTVRVKRVSVGATNTTLVTAQSLQLRMRFLPVTVTNGSGGSSPTFRQNDPGDAAPSVTAKANSTTPATTNGTALTLQEWGVHIFAGLDYSFPIGREPVVGPSESVVFELLSTVTGTVAMSGTVDVEESGG